MPCRAAHGISSAGMFFMVGVVYDRVHHRNLNEFGGIMARMPVYSGFAIIIFFAGLGALGGAMLGETWKGRDLKTSWEVGHSAFWGRVLGSLAKVLIASIMLAVGATAVFIA